MSENVHGLGTKKKNEFEQNRKMGYEQIKEIAF